MKRHLPLAAILIMALASLSFAKEATPSPSPKPRAPRVTQAMLQKDLAEKETALWNAFKNKDMKPFDMYLGKDVVVVDSAGVMAKGSLPEGMKMCDIKSFTLSDWKMTKPTTTTALLVYKGPRKEPVAAPRYHRPFG
ncbi:MAG: hypothetical protein ACT4OT_00040 [Acidobacteriota bacterium]